MCGILGSTHITPEALKRAAPCIAYRGPDDTGYFIEGSFGVAHHRLAIIDVDARSNQPMTDQESGVTIAYNGEIYNFKEVRESLPNTHTYLTASDTEVLLHAYRTYGTAFVSKLRGMFALAIYDPSQKCVILARDHAGIKPLYYSTQNNTLTFSSEVKGVAALLRENGVTIKPNAEALSLSLLFGYIPPPYTLIQNVESVRPGTVVVWDLEKSAVRSIESWEPDVEVSTLKKAVAESVAEHLVSDVPVGLFYSGGIDSTVILSELKKLGADLTLYTLAQDGKEVDAEAARSVASALHAHERKIVPLTAESFGRAYTTVMDAIDEPIADTALFPTTLLAMEAKNDVKVVLSGEGGDELFYGYARQKALSTMRSFDRELSSLDHIYLSLPSFGGKNSLFLFLFRFFKQPLSYYLLTLSPSYGFVSAKVLASGKQLLAQSVHKPADLDSSLYLEGTLLRKLDMATSYASIEGRVPLLDARLFALSQTLEPTEQFDAQGGKRTLRQLLAAYVPASLLNRPKSGFGTWRAPFIKEHAPYRSDVARGVNLIHELNIQISDAPILIENNPRLAMLVASIARAYDNIGISHEAA